MATQNCRRSSRGATGGRPGEYSGPRPARSERRRLVVVTRHRSCPVLRRPIESTEYAAVAFRDRLRALGIQQSSVQRGPEDNAHVESFFHSLKAELIHGTRFESEAALRRELRRYIHYYNQQRRHSALVYQSPADYESCAA